MWRVRLYSLTFLGSPLGVWRGPLRCVELRLLCRVEEGSDQLGYVAMGYVRLRQFSRGWVFLDQLGSVEAVMLQFVWVG